LFVRTFFPVQHFVDPDKLHTFRLALRALGPECLQGDIDHILDSLDDELTIDEDDLDTLTHALELELNRY